MALPLLSIIAMPQHSITIFRKVKVRGQKKCRLSLYDCPILWVLFTHHSVGIRIPWLFTLIFCSPPCIIHMWNTEMKNCMVGNFWIDSQKLKWNSNDMPQLGIIWCSISHCYYTVLKNTQNDLFKSTFLAGKGSFHMLQMMLHDIVCSQHVTTGTNLSSFA